MIVNGQFIILEKKQSLYDFLTQQKYELSAIAVERNGEIVPKGTYKDVIIKDHDNLEIVQFVGGG